MKKIMIVNTSATEYTGTGKPTGLWLGELVHFYDVFNNNDFEIDLFSVSGGRIPIDPASISKAMLDKTTQKYYEDETFMEMLSNTREISEADSSLYDVIYFTGGHGTMFDFPGNSDIQKAILTVHKNNGIISAVCHGVSALIDVKNEDGSYFISGRHLTGFSTLEEKLARRTNYVPFLLESLLNTQGAVYSKSIIPFKSFTVKDQRLITGQNPQSPKEVAEKVKAALQNSL
ncbi:type 1 glutamine amidotransferase domain-containing protein [Corticicoccus populi]|uniref:Type 1 glutamine amidotransferase domain-containing protein n=1 Tax=Corticicoccus populi TaxID=1812821 RepID=A0ABW5WWA0_9STAP